MQSDKSFIRFLSGTIIFLVIGLLFLIIPDFYKKSLQDTLQPTYSEYVDVTPEKYHQEYIRAKLLSNYERERATLTQIHNLGMWYVPIHCKSQFRNVLAGTPWSDPQLRVNCSWFGSDTWD